MQSQPPQFIDPLRLAGQGVQLSGRLPISQLGRLREAVSDDTGEIEYMLEFGRDAGGIHCIIGNLTATLNMQCQRCMQIMPLVLRGDIQLGIVQGEEEARRLAPAYEPLLVERKSLRLAELVEDEALLLLPLVPMHEDTDCADDAVNKVLVEPAAEAREQDLAQEDTHRPFADQLDKLRQREK